MATFNRRRFLQTSGMLAAGAALAACDTAPKGGKDAKGALTWWDHRAPLRKLHEEIFAKFAKMPGGMPVQFTPQQTDKMGQALQLAKQSKQLPDAFTNVGLMLPFPALVQQGWFSPLDWDDEVLKRFPPGSMVEGIHTLDGKVYSFPIFTHKQYWAPNWYNKELLEKVGLDPANPPTTYDDFRAACRVVQKKGGDGVYGWIFNLGQPPRVVEQVGYLAQAAGWGGTLGAVGGGRDFKTGQFVFDNDAHVTAIEFLLSLAKDKLMFPGSGNLIDKVARTRWSAGAAAFYFDGPWCPGVVDLELKQFSPKVDVGPMLVPDSSTELATYKGPDQGAFFASGTTKHPDVVSELMKLFSDTEYHLGLAENMAQPPLDPTVIEKADVHPAYRKLLGLFEGHTFLAPNATSNNPEIYKVEQERKPITPGLGEIVQGAFSGDVKDLRKALKELSDKSNAEDERAIAAAKKKGAQVSAEDYTFPDWQPGADYGPDKYGK
ncbi:MAG: ABC transporter substrate-binding protein [Micromonosporaceae bacterium]